MSSLKAIGLTLLVAALGLRLLLLPSTSFFKPKTQKESPWLFQVLALWGQRQAEIAWHRGGEPDDPPQGRLNQMKYRADWALAREAARLNSFANYQLAAVWYRFSVTLDKQDVENWRLAAFLASQAGDIKKTRQYMRAALDAFPNHPLVLLEKSVLLGPYEHPRIHRQWAEQAYNAFQQTRDKSIFSMLDFRMFFFEYANAIWHGDRHFKDPANRRKVIQIYLELAKYEPIALERSPLYKRLVQMEKEKEEKLRDSTPPSKNQPSPSPK